MIERRCQQCGKSFFIAPSGIKHGEGKYCSRECADKAKKGKPSPNKGKKTGKPAWNRGKHPSPETLKKLSESHMGQIPANKGIPHTEEAKLKMSESHKRNPSRAWLGKHRSEETIRKIRETRSKKPRVHPKSEFKKGQTYEERYGAEKAQQMKEKRRKYANEHRDEYRDRILKLYEMGKITGMRGKHHTEETKRKISETKKGKPSLLKGKPSQLKGKNRTKIEKRCLKCDKPFFTYPSLVQDGKGKFCSRDCKNASQIGKPGGHKGIPHSEEAKRRISEANKGKPSGMEGKHHTEEAKMKNSEAHKGKRASPATEFKKGQRASPEYEFKKGHIPANKGRTGLLTEEALGKMRESRAKQKFPQEDSIPERLIFGELDKRGIQYSKHYSIKTKGSLTQPDVAFPEIKLAVYLDGCYWHACPICYKKLTEQQIKQIPKNKKREFIKSLGWKLIMFWGHEILQNPEKIANKIIEEAVKSRSKI
jgi:DNA mismatch endonuclease (patch repair protein)